MLWESAFPPQNGFYLPHLLVLQEAQQGMSRTEKHRTASGCAAEHDERSKTTLAVKSFHLMMQRCKVLV